MSAALLLSSFVAPTPTVLKIADPDEARRERGRSIAAICRIEERKPGLWIVPAQSGGGSYWVKTDNSPPTCTCKDFDTREKPCKHIHAVRLLIEQRVNPAMIEPVPPPEIPDAVAPKVLRQQMTAPRPTYKQDWPAYNRAQINEKSKFLTLLTELCRGIPEPPAGPKGGRPPIPMADRAFACALKVYTTISGRRASTDIRDARDKGHLSRAPHYSRVSRFLEDPAMTPILMGLIAESAKPLRSIESDFVVDSTGFATSRFVRWYDHKYGVVRQKYDWVKAHLMTGVKTNVVTAVVIGDRDAHDCPQFKPLFRGTVGNGFNVRECSADAAYLSHENMEMVGSVGGTPYICFKSNTTAAAGGLMAKMFHLYNLNRDEYLAHYHKRSNVESTNMMLKSKFGDSVRARTDVAMANEALCKVLCHNLCCVIQSTYELGVGATFWGQEPAEQEPAGPAMDDFANLMAWV